MQFRNRLADLYGSSILQEPRSLTEANDYNELAAIIDYYAFYQLSGTEFLCNTFMVKLNFAYNDADDVINNVYWNCELIRSGAGIYGELERNNKIVLTLIPYDLAKTSNRATTDRIVRYSSLIEYKSENETIPRDNDFDDFPYKNYGKTIKGIWNTQQLWYALEHEYVPECVADSPAEQVLIKAKELLRQIVKEGMSNEEKIFSIYSWFAENVQYDYKYTQDFYQSVLEKYPEAATSKAFHIEGALIDGLAVCEGYAKSYLLLLRLEGIESYRITKSYAIRGRIIQNSNGQKYYSGGYGSHAFVGIRMSNGQLYYSDTEQSVDSSKQDIMSYQQFMVPASLFVGYGGNTYLLPDIEFGDSYWEGYNNLCFNDMSLFVNNLEELRDLRDAIAIYFEDGLSISIFGDLVKYPEFENDFRELFDFDYVTKKSSNSSATFVEYVIFINDESVI